MNIRAAVLAAFVLFVSEARAQAPRTVADILPQDVVLPDWGVKSIEEIKAGSLGVLHEKKDRIEIYRLRKLPPEKPNVTEFKSRTPELRTGAFVVSHFDEGNQNSLGGHFNVYKRYPSTAVCGIEESSDGRRALTVHFNRAATGFCGMWVHFFNLKLDDEKRIFLNAEPFREMTFWVRGRQGGEKIWIKVSDASWDKKEDALPVGELSAFIESGRIETSWQLARVPLAAFPDAIVRKELAGLVFDIGEESEGAIEIKTLAFVAEGGKPPEIPPAPHSSAKIPEPENLATWVWETTRIMGSPKDQDELIEFMTKMKINHLFLQLPNEPERLGPDGGVVIETEKMRRLLKRFNEKKIMVHALDGWKMFALPEYHAAVLSSVRNVIRYNKEVKPDERFYGFHYDIEPYLLSGFGGARKDFILKNYLTIIKKSRDLAHEAKMIYGCDIPFWFDSPDDFTHEFFVVEFDGKKKFVHEHVIDLMDNVGIMDYRTVAYGADGVLAHASGELEYAAKQKRKMIFVGLETYALPDETLWMFRTPGQRGLPLLASGTFLFAAPKTDTVATFYFVPESKLEEFKGKMEAEKTPKDKLLYWRIRENIFIPSSKITFAHLPSADFKKACRQSLFELNRHPAFYGLAIHYYETYRDLLKR